MRTTTTATTRPPAQREQTSLLAHTPFRCCTVPQMSAEIVTVASLVGGIAASVIWNQPLIAVILAPGALAKGWSWVNDYRNYQLREALKKENGVLKGETERLGQIENEMGVSVQALESIKDSFAKLHSEAAKDNKDLANVLDKSIKKLEEEQNQESTDMQGRLGQLKNLIGVIQSYFRTLDPEKLNQEIKKHLTELADMERMIGHSEGELEATTKSLENVQGKLQRVERELESKTNELGTLEKQFQETVNQLKQVEEKLNGKKPV